MATQSSKGYRNLISLDHVVLVIVDCDPQLLAHQSDEPIGVSLDPVAAMVRLAEAFGVPTLLASAAANSKDSRRPHELRKLLPGGKVFQRVNLNPWENEDFRDSVESMGRRQVLIAGQEAEASMTVTALAGLEEGFDVYVVRESARDDLGGLTEIAFDRMTQAGAVPITWQQVVLEWQRDWPKAETLQTVTEALEGIRSGNARRST